MPPSNKCQSIESKPFCQCLDSSKEKAQFDILGVIFSLRVFMPSYKINLVIVQEKKNSKNLHVNPRYTNKSFFLLSLYIQHPLRNLSTCSPNPIQIRPRTLADMIKTLSSLTLPSLPCCQWPSLLTDCVDVPYH